MPGDDNCPEVMVKFKKLWNSWERLTRIVVWEGAKLRVPGMLFKAKVQAVFIFGSATWVMKPCMERSLGSFQHRVF